MLRNDIDKFYRVKTEETTTCSWCDKEIYFDKIYFSANEICFCCKECFEHYYEEIPIVGLKP